MKLLTTETMLGVEAHKSVRSRLSFLL